MVLSDEKKREYMRRLLLSRTRILCRNGFYGLLLMHAVYAIDEGCETAATDGKRIFFAPEFLDSLSDTELDFIMMHEILHIVLQHCFRQGDRDCDIFNIACDIVVNSNILLSAKMNINAITLSRYGESMHKAPDGKEGYEYTAEEVYKMLCSKSPNNIPNSPGTDDHSRWGTLEEDDHAADVWSKHLTDACEAVLSQDPSDLRGLLPLFARRMLQELKAPQTDWRAILADFVQEEIVDYSFSPPDRRFEDSPFFLPDFNEKDDVPEDILFMIDTSGSMSDEMITAAYSEVKGAIDQFNGKLKGWLGFFDAAVIEPKPFSDEGEFRIIQPEGGGGTDFEVIFEYVNNHMQDKPPASIIILTDGYAPFPDEKIARGVPVLWLLNNEGVNPPWGKVARITVS